MPESFKVLLKELQALCLDVKVLMEDDTEIEIREDIEEGEVVPVDVNMEGLEDKTHGHGYIRREEGGMSDDLMIDPTDDLYEEEPLAEPLLEVDLQTGDAIGVTEGEAEVVEPDDMPDDMPDMIDEDEFPLADLETEFGIIEDEEEDLNEKMTDEDFGIFSDDDEE